MAERHISLDIDSCFGCKQCEISCAVEHSRSKDLWQAIFESPLPRHRTAVVKVGSDYYSLRCAHCDDAPCVTACMSGAMYKDTDTGLVLNDPERCVGCWMCIMVCPLGAIKRGETSIALKCDFCPEREVPACVSDCPTKALSVEISA